MQEQTSTALREALTAQQLPFVQGEPLAPHTTFKIGGPACFWCAPKDVRQLCRTLQLCLTMPDLTVRSSTCAVCQRWSILMLIQM